MKRVYKIVFEVIFFLLLALGILATAAHYLIQELDLFRHQVVNYIEDHTGSTVKIGTIKTEWNGIVPSFQLDNISFKNASLTGTIKTLNINVDLYRSIIHQRYQLGHLSINGIDIKMSPTLSQLLSQHGSTSELDDVFSTFLFHQLNDVDLHNMSLSVAQTNGGLITFNLPQFHWLNDGSQHQGEGVVKIVRAHQQDGILNLQLNLTSKAGKLENGVIYFTANKVDIAPLLSENLSSQINLIQSNISLKTWVNIQNGEIKNIAAILPNASLDWQKGQQQHQLKAQQQLLYFTHNQQGWDLSLPKVQMTLDGHPFSDLPIELNWKGSHLHWYNFYQAKQLDLHLAALSLGQISPLVGLFSPLYPKVYQYWKTLQPHGQLQQLNLSLHLDDLLQSTFHVRWQDISWSADHQIPGFSHLSGTLQGTVQQGNLALNMQQGSLDYPYYFPDRIPIKKLQAAINWQYSSKGLKITAKNLLIQTPSLALHGSSAYYHLKGGQPWLSIAAGMNITDAQKVYHYYPKHIMSHGVIKYLTSAIQGGVAKKGIVLFSGNPSDFPYRSAQQGLFQIYFPLDHAKFQFNPNWPTLTDSNLVLNFLNDSLTVSAAKLDLAGITVSHLIAKIPHYTDQQVLITANVQGEGAVIGNYFNQTPLKASLGSALQKVKIAGEVSGKLKLDIPFDGHRLPQVTGKVTLPGNEVTLTPLDIQLKQVEGVFSFINGDITAQNLQAQWGEQPISLDLLTDSESKNYQIQIGVQGNWAMNHLPLPSLLRDQLSGKAAWQMKVGIDIPSSGLPNYQVLLNADLSQISSQLPSPLHFKPTKNTGLNLTAKGKGDNFNVQGLIAGNSVNSDWQVELNKITLQKLVWQTQQQTIPALPHSSLAEIELPEINIDLKNWLQYQSLFTNKESSMSYQLPKQVIVNINNLKVLKQQWNQLQLIYQSGPQSKLLFNGTDIDGSLTISQDQPWDLNLSYLYFNPGGLSLSKLLDMSASKTSSKAPIAIQSLATYPTLNFNCADCWLFGQRLNTVTADIVTTPDQLSINKGEINTDVGKLIFSLNWQLGKTQTTQLSVTLNGDNLTKFNQYLNIPPSVSGKKFNFESNLKWQGSPWQPQISTLNGSVSGKLGKGVIHSIQMGKAGQILNVLSLEPLIRQLQSDFSDVFDNGFYFNSILSRSTIKNGVMRLNQLDINGLAAYVSLLGELDLNDNRINVEAKVTPEISAGVGIATAFAVNPLAGVFAYVGSKLFSPIWRNIFLVHYTISGSITDPKIQQNEIKTRKISH